MQKKCCFRLSFSLHSETASHPSPSNVLHVVPVGQPTCQHQAAHDSRCAHCVAHLRKIGIWRTHARRPFHLCALLVQVASRIRRGMAGPTELCNFWYGVVARRIRRHGRKRAATQEKRHIFRFTVFARIFVTKKNCPNTLYGIIYTNKFRFSLRHWVYMHCGAI